MRHQLRMQQLDLIAQISELLLDARKSLIA
jgi:hypothetical protein